VLSASCLGACANPGQAIIAPMLCVTLNPGITPANPTNGNVIASDNTKIFQVNSSNVQSVTWSLASTGFSTKIWIDTANLPNTGCFQIGNQQIGTISGIFDMRFSLLCEFANPK